MRFDPGCLVLFVRSTRDESGLPLESAEEAGTASSVKNRLLHERDHLVRHLSTSYGWTRFALNAQLVYFSFQLARSLANCGQSLTFPLVGSQSDDFRRSLKNNSLYLRDKSEMRLVLGDPVLSRKSFYLGVLDLMLALDGHIPPTDDFNVIQMLRGWHSRCGGTEFPLRWEEEPEPELSRFYDEDIGSLLPHVDRLPFGAEHILEFYGLLREMFSAQNEGAAPDVWSDLTGIDEYVRVLRLFGSYFFDEKQHGGWPLELEAASELALWLPITPKGIVDGGAGLTWYDIQPGWRFLRACNYLAKSDRDWCLSPPTDDASRDRTLRTIQQEICNALKWPSVETILDDWIRALSTPSSVPTALLLDIERPSARKYFGLRLLRERRASTGAFYFTGLNTSNYDDAPMFSGFVFTDADNAFTGEAWKGPNDNHTNWLEYELITGSRFLAEGFAAHPHVRARHFETMSASLRAFYTNAGVSVDAFDSATERYLGESGVRAYWKEVDLENTMKNAT